MIHENIILKSPKGLRDSLAVNITDNLAAYPNEDMIGSGSLQKKLIQLGFMDKNDKATRENLETILKLLKSVQVD